MDTNIELKNHLYLEFKRNNMFPMFLNETRGVVDEMDSIVKLFSLMVLPQIKETFKTGRTTKIMYDETTDDFIYSGMKTFFKKFNLLLTVSAGEKNTYNGNTPLSSIKEDEGNYFCEPAIVLNITAKNWLKGQEIFEFAIAHELTHCFNLLQYAIKNNRLPHVNIAFRNKYLNINKAKNSENNNYSAVADMLYLLTRIERNAYIAQLRQELLRRKKEMVDYKSLFNLIKTTESYKKFMALENNIDIILNENNFSPTEKENLVTYLNNIMETNFSNYNQFSKYFNRRWEKWKKAYLINASKIAYDVFAENNVYLDGPNMDKNITLKPK